MIDKQLLDILACPLCKTAVILKAGRLVCSQCGRRYPVLMVCPNCKTEKTLEPRTSACPGCGRRYSSADSIPIMLVEEAELPEARKQR